MNTRFSTKTGGADEWRYCVSSRALTAEQLLRHARLEWPVESMHWLLDVHFSGGFCRADDKNVQKNLNIARKIALNSVKSHKERTKSKNALSRIMFDCLLDCENLLPILAGGDSGA